MEAKNSVPAGLDPNRIFKAGRREGPRALPFYRIHRLCRPNRRKKVFSTAPKYPIVPPSGLWYNHCEFI